MMGVSGPAAHFGPEITSEEVVRLVGHALDAYGGKGTTDDEDQVFEAHGALIRARLPSGDLREVCNLWASRIEPLVRTKEATLRKSIHKGAPLYNTGLAFFVAGDFDFALSYFIAADKEDVANKGTHSFMVVTGHHPLSAEVLVDPLANTLVPHWTTNYRDVTGSALTPDEIKTLLQWLASEPMDCVQVLIALHRFKRSLDGLNNQAAQHVRVRSIADILTVLESNLKKRFSPTIKMLGALLTDLQQGKQTLTSFNQLNSNFDAAYPQRTPVRHSTVATNWIITTAITRIKSATARADRMGLVCSLAQHLRNGLAHSVDPTLDIYSNRPLAIEVAGLAFSALRIAKHGADNTL